MTKSPESLMPDFALAVEDLSEQATELDGKPEMSQVVGQLCESYRALAICILAADGDVDRFFHFLLHAPLTRRRYLATVGSLAGTPAAEKKASETGPLLDAVAARQWDLARDIATLTLGQWIDNSEYEEDYCHGEYWRRLCMEPGKDESALLDRWGNALEGGKDPRLEVARALNMKDQAAFVAALAALLLYNETKAEEMSNPLGGSALSEEPTFEPNRWVSIEGLAWLAAAERAGMVIAEEFEGCPRIVRTDRYTPFKPFAYPNLGLAGG
jgi:hypothetical protein